MFRFWVVKDPVIGGGDFIFETHMNKFASYIVGTGIEKFHKENHTIHATEEAAKDDAKQRLRYLVETWTEQISEL